MRLIYSHFYTPKYCLYSKPIKNLQGYGIECSFSFIVKENDNKVDGQQENGMRIFDKRLSRFKSVNPKMDSFKGGSDVTMEVDIGKENK